MNEKLNDIVFLVILDINHQEKNVVGQTLCINGCHLMINQDKCVIMYLYVPCTKYVKIEIINQHQCNSKQVKYLVSLLLTAFKIFL